jgi:hypothetical protein
MKKYHNWFEKNDVSVGNIPLVSKVENLSFHSIRVENERIYRCLASAKDITIGQAIATKNFLGLVFLRFDYPKIYSRRMKDE